MEGFYATADPGVARPLVLVAHAWGGQGEQERKKAVALAGLGYAGFAADLYGKGRRGSSAEENQALMTPLVEDRASIVVGMDAALAAARRLEGVDSAAAAAIGFCFGGLCVLDLARSGADIAGVVSFHGLFNAPPQPSAGIRAKVLALHGWDDPMVPPEQVVALAQELTAAGADWQLQAYGNTMHAFTNPGANDRDFGTVYDATADQRSWLAMQNFLAELFPPK
ncbi:MAG: dienelactone hydrolase family protein [Gammaproteobacteria bacterium]|nr:dienelactone hydrolase family protein [Gammaproteobacteria bacterium]NNF61331.1 prolyl oligopeptidase family serine peptidase [Gammaproteobacteria bacterium]NNM20756.1 prolyl oligopeptidase family serine peptidase [Gammaproteobacteria bacterium]